MKNLKMGFAALRNGKPKPDPEYGQTPEKMLHDYQGDYILRQRVTLFTLLSFASSGILLIVGSSAYLYFMVIKKDTADELDLPETVPTVVAPGPDFE